MLDDLATIIPAAGLGGVATWIGQAAAAWFKSRNERQLRQEDIALDVEQHRDQLTFDLLKAAREEVAAARIEAAELRSMQMRLVHFDEAIDHIEQLLMARTEEDRIAVERRAQQFLVRMRRFSEAAGALRNEAQVQASRNDPTASELTEIMRKIP